MPNIATRVARIATLVLLGALHTLSADAADSSTPRPRAALVIGNASYSAVNPLKNPASDAHDMCDALGHLGYKTSCFVDVRDAREFKARIQDFTASLKPKSEVLFYYAGHAVQVRGENYLVPITARLRAEPDVPRETISLNYIMTQLLQAKHYLNIVILDACRSNPWADNPKGLTAGLAPITAIPRGTMVMYATAANDVSDDGEGRNGTLTKNLLANINLPGLTVDEFFKRVSEGVQADSAAAVNHAQTPALYTNFTGEFCFAGCIDKVARAELDRMQKANEQQLQQMRQEKAQLEADKRAAEAKLASAVTSMNCDKSVLNDSGQCFAAPTDKTVRAVAQALLQKGYRIREGSIARGVVEGERSLDDSQNKSLTDVLTATATVKAVPITGHSVVTISATQRTVLHDEYQKWGNVSGLIPLPTSKEYQDVVKKEVTITDAAFYSDLFAAIERNLRSDSVGAAQLSAEAPSTAPSSTAPAVASAIAPAATSAAAPATTQSAGAEADAAVVAAATPGTTVASTSAAAVAPAVAPAADTADAAAHALPVSLVAAPAAAPAPLTALASSPAPSSASAPTPPRSSAANTGSGHQHQYSASWDKTEHALLEVLVTRGYVVDTIKPEFGLINANNKAQDKKDERISIDTDISASVIPTDGGSQIQMSASAQKVVHRKPGSRLAGALLGYEPHDYRTVVKTDSAVEDPAFYADLFTAVERTLHGGDPLPPMRAREFSASLSRSMRAAMEDLSEQGFSIVRTDEKLGLVTAARRTATPTENQDGWTASYVHASIYVRSSGADSVFFVSAHMQDALFRVSSRYAYSSQQLKDPASQRMHDIDCQDCPPEEMRAAILLLMNSPTSQEIVTRESEVDAGFYTNTFAIMNRKLADTATTSASAQ